jgi:hypothetical protein
MADNTVVTELIVDASGATKELGDYGSAMDSASAAANKTVSANMSVQDAVTKSSTVLTGTTRSTTSYGTAFDALTNRYDAASKANSTWSNAVKTADAAVAHGAITQAQANATLGLVQNSLMAGAKSTGIMQVASQQLSLQMVAMSAGLGPAGVLLAAFGPVGLAVGVGLGLAIDAFNATAQAAHNLANESIELTKFSETTGLTTTQLEALSDAAAQHGVSANDATQAIVRFTTAWEQARQGGGTFLTALRGVDAGLADQIQRATSSAAAFDILTQAINAANAAGNVGQRNALLRAAGGRGGVTALTGVSAAVGQAGGLDALTQNFEDSKQGISADLIPALTQLQTEIDNTKKHADNLFASIGAENILKTEKSWQDMRLQIAGVLSDMANGSSSLSAWDQFLLRLTNFTMGPDTAVRLFLPPSNGMSQPALNQHPAYPPQLDMTGLTPTLPKTPSAIAADRKLTVSTLGDAATATDKYNSRVADLAAELSKGEISQDLYNKAIAGADFDFYTQKLGLFNSAMGLSATVTDTVNQKVATLQKQQQQGAGLSDTQYANAKRLIQAQADGTFALQTRIDATNVQISTLGMAAGAAETYSLIQTKMNDNLNAGKPALDGISASFITLANNAGAAAQKLKDTQSLTNLQFQGKTQFMSGPDAAAATTAQSLYGNDWQSHLNDAAPAQAKFNAQLAQSRDLSADFANNFGQAMLQGKSGAAALQTAVQSLASSLIQIATKNLVNAAFGGLTGSASTGIFAGIPKLFGFADGGYTGSLGTQQVAGVVHGQEFVVNADATSRYRGLLEAINSSPIRGYAAGGYVTTPNSPSTAPSIGNWNAGGGQQPLTVEQHFHISGVTGEELSQKTQAAATQSLKQAIGYTDGSIKNYDRNTLPSRIPEIQARQL